ncbi:MAG TPA: galactosyldiacylglycerol synthase [Terriglobia bacterium]|nr:galactosyldiacylglycerol synthase [Terriglobia bacterium]
MVYFDAGGGHRAAAGALRLVIEQSTPWQVETINLQEMLDPIDIAKRLTGLRSQDVYNFLLKQGWTRGMTPMLPVLHGVIRLHRRSIVHLLEPRWRDGPPHVLVSLIPHFNRPLRESFWNIRAAGQFVTILTDLADCPPHFWIEPPRRNRQQHVVCGTARAVEQARAAGLGADHVHRVSGMILHPRFYQPPGMPDLSQLTRIAKPPGRPGTPEPAGPLEPGEPQEVLDRGRARVRLGLDPEAVTGLVMFGGQGSSAMLEIARRLDASSAGVQLIFICGHNERLRLALSRGPHRLRRAVVGYTSEVPAWLHLADFFIGKPGPGSLSEALHMKRPVIVELNARTMPQERYNAEWVLEKQVGIVVPNFRHIAGAVERMIRPENFARFQAHAARLKNRAVFEIVDVLRGILESAAAPDPADPSASPPAHAVAG